MEASEVLAFLPLLIYGIAIAELFSQWKRFIDFKSLYLPYTLLTILLTEIALYNVYLFSQLVGEINTMNYKRYLLYIVPPFIFMISVYIFTPEKEDDTEVYFKQNMPIFFTLIALFVASHFFFKYEEIYIMYVARIIIIIWLLLTGFLRKIWMVYVFVAIWFLLFLNR